MLIEVEWTFLDHDWHPLWADNFCLYVYLHPKLDRLLYLTRQVKHNREDDSGEHYELGTEF